MWSEYDEMLLQNPFFVELQEHHKDILEKSSQDNWTICVPRIGTFELDDVTAEAILDHILVPEEKNDTYHTLSKKTVLVQNRHIIEHPSHESIGILFEETFYVQNKSKYKVWCIDGPVFRKRRNALAQSIKVIEDLRDCLDFLWGHTILDGIKNSVLNWTAEFETIEAEDLQSQKEFVGVLFSQCLQVCMKNKSVRDKVEDNLFFENFKLAVETYMQYCLSRRLLYSIGSACHQADSHLTKIIKNSSHLQYRSLGISCKFLNVITRAKSELSKINNYFTTLEKISCLRKTLDIFQDPSLGIAHITLDLILPVLVFLIVKSNIYNWIANLVYLKEFRLSSLTTSDRVSFVVASLEAAIEFIRSSEFLFLMRTKPQLCHPLCNCIKCRSSEIDNRSLVEDATDSIHCAASRGYQTILLSLLNSPVDPNAVDNDGNSPLHLACLNGHENCVKALIYSSKITNMDCRNGSGDTPLHLATVCGYFEIVKILLENGASPSAKNKRNRAPLDLAPNCYIKNVLRQSLAQAFEAETSQPIEQRNEHCKKIDLLLKAIESNDLPLTRFYLGPNTNDRCHPLCRCEECDAKLGQTSPESVGVNACDATGRTPLHAAAKFGRAEIARLLLGCGALRNAKTDAGRTPLHLACIDKRARVVEELLEGGGCDVDAVDAAGNTALGYACDNNDVEIAKMLLRSGADCRIRNRAGESAFRRCQENMQYSLIKIMNANSCSNSVDKDLI